MEYSIAKMGDDIRIFFSNLWNARSTTFSGKRKIQLSICSDKLQPFQVRIFKNFSLLIKLYFFKSTLIRHTLKTHKQCFRSLGNERFKLKYTLSGFVPNIKISIWFQMKKKKSHSENNININDNKVIVFFFKKKLAHVYKCNYGKLSQWVWRKFSELSC